MRFWKNFVAIFSALIVFSVLILSFNIAGAQGSNNILELSPFTIRKINPTIFEVVISYQDNQGNPIAGQEKEILLLATGGTDWYKDYRVSEISNGLYKARFDVDVPEGVFYLQAIVPEIISNDPLVSKIAVSSNVVKVQNQKTNFLILGENSNNQQTQIDQLTPISSLETKILAFFDISLPVSFSATYKEIPVVMHLGERVNPKTASKMVNEANDIYAKNNSNIRLKLQDTKSLPEGIVDKADRNRDGNIDRYYYKKNDVDSFIDHAPGEMETILKNLPQTAGDNNTIDVMVTGEKITSGPHESALGIVNERGGNKILIGKGGETGTTLTHEIMHSLGETHVVPDSEETYSEDDLSNLMFPLSLKNYDQTKITPEQNKRMEEVYDAKSRGEKLEFPEKGEQEASLIKDDNTNLLSDTSRNANITQNNKRNSTFVSNEEGTGLVQCGNPGQSDCGICDLFKLVSIIVNFITYKIATPLATIMLIYGGVMLIISGGSEDRKKKGLNAIWAAVWGLAIVFGAWLIVNTIINSLASDTFSGGWNKFPGCP